VDSTVRVVRVLTSRASLCGMGIFDGKTLDEKAADDARKQAERAVRDARKQTDLEKEEYEEWLKTPPGQARLAYQQGFSVFQCWVNLHTYEAKKVHGTANLIAAKNPSRLLSEVCAEGWELVSGSVVYVPGSDDAPLVLTAVGSTVGYYLFRRSPDGHRG
jgi:hypothetical protein